MTREIKFRAWGKTDNRIKDWKQILKCGFENILINDSFYELMQFTGLKDKNGKEIFEGDIVEFRYWEEGERLQDIMVVEFEDGSFNAWNKKGLNIGDFKNEIANERIEVIGNKFENPELLDALEINDGEQGK